MPERWIPDGSGGFIKDVGAGGLEMIGVILLAIGAALMAPLMVGMLGAFLIVGILTALFPLSSTVTTGIVLYLFVSALYFVGFGVIYSFFFSKMSFWGKVGWAIAVLSMACSPLMALYSAYGGEIFGVGLSTKVTQIAEESPTQNIYVIKNTGKDPIYASIVINNVCFTDATTFTPSGVWNAPTFILTPGNEITFYCNEHVKRVPLIQNENNMNEELDQCIYVFKSLQYTNDSYRKLCYSQNWK